MNWLPRKKVVVPVDFAEASVGALQTAAQMVAHPGDMHVMHVLTPLDNIGPYVMWRGIDDTTRENDARKFMHEFLQKHGYGEATAAVRLGDPGLEIAAYAKNEQADLIVISSHGYHGVKRFLLGSVAERVVRHADCPVLILRRPDAD